MIVVDSSIWIDHIQAGEPLLDAHLMREQAMMHPHVLGEVALGSIKDRDLVLYRCGRLPVPNVAKEGHVLHLIDRQKLWATGIGYTDAQLLASALLTPDGLLWTRDKRLLAQAERLGIAYAP
jgi:predicted nucleic acid-binding protein